MSPSGVKKCVWVVNTFKYYYYYAKQQLVKLMKHAKEKHQNHEQNIHFYIGT